MSETGMSPEPMAVYSLASRLICARCGTEPRIKRADGRNPVTITVACHGQEETRVIERKELVFTQHFFKDEDTYHE